MRYGTREAARAFWALVAFSLAVSISAVARAGGPLGPEGSRIETSNYGVDLFQGPVLASTRITALGGAFTPIAEGPDGIPFNPAAPSVRPPYSTSRDDYDLTASITLPASVEGTDFDNNGHVGFAYDNFVWVTAGGIIQTRHLAFGLIVSFQNYQLGAPQEAVPLPGSGEVVTAITQRIFKLDPVVSYGFLDDELHVGAGPRLALFYSVGRVGTFSAVIPEERILLNANAVGLQGGALWAPKRLPLRVGAAARSPVVPLGEDIGRIQPDENGDSVVGNIYLPNRVELPWELEGGIAVQLWKRPFNLPWYDEDEVPEAESDPYRQTICGEKEPSYRAARRLLKQRYHSIPRERLLLSFSALVSGPVKNAVGLESMLSQRVERSGKKVVGTLRGGVEAEVIPYWLVLRAGSYLEPTRFQAAESRFHGTTGFDVRFLRSSIWGLWDEGTVFRVSGAVDAARDYFGWSVGLGVMR